MSFLPTPLHPAVVHFPIVFAVLAPIFAIGALIAIRRGSRPLVAWGLTVALVGGLVASAWAALETGEQQEDRVEPVVAEQAFETHEEAAEAFLGATIALLAVALVGFAPRGAGRAARIVATLGTFVIVGLGYRVGHSGGRLAYQEGGAAAYAAGSPGVGASRSERE